MPPTEPGRYDVVIVGAGLAGLAAAIPLQRAGRSVTVLEASDGIGGRVRTDIIDGFRCDRGFQVLLTEYPELARQLDVAALDLCAFDPGALVWHRGRGVVAGDPFRKPSTLFSTMRAPVGTIADKARLLKARRRWMSTPVQQLLRQRDISTAEALHAAGFSETMIERFFTPLAGGIQLDPNLGTSVRMFDTIMAMLSRGAGTVPAAGMEAIPQQLADRLATGTVQLNSAVAAIEGHAVRLHDGRVLDASAVIVATEGPVAARLVPIATVGSKPVGCVYFAADQAPTAHKLVVLDADSSGPALNVAVMSNIAPSYAPPGKHLIVAATPGDIGDDLADRVRNQLRGWWGGRVDSWRDLVTYRIAHGQPTDAPPFAPRQPVALGDGLFVCGDHRDTASIQGALFSGRRCGEAALVALAAAS